MAAPIECIPIDLVDPDKYTRQPGTRTDPADDPLLQDEVSTQPQKEKAPAAAVTWLRANHYIQNEVSQISGSRVGLG